MDSNNQPVRLSGQCPSARLLLGCLARKDYVGAHEWCFYGWREGAAHQFFGPTNATDLWLVKRNGSRVGRTAWRG